MRKKPKKPGRPRKAVEDRRSIQLTFTVSTSEFDEIEAAAGDNLSRYIRGAVLKDARNRRGR